ncbi:snurportin-1 [Spodoptera litura]|uniref:Snurportin-1 n=1 Tax=Spodoptera litura TaxID=69820 RepID=A0A9J7E4L9_SPOLT|nr:snurportin-1 [Spodoptera litura]
MDEVLDQLNKTSFIDLYKQKGDNQEQRRKDLLDAQKSLRNNLVDTCRGILALVDAAENNDCFQEKKALYKPKIFVAGFTRCAYSNVLMLSEWMVEQPEDFHENWYVVPCPKGVRTLVVANRGTTKLYSKYGQFRGEYKTALPGGSGALKNRCCILDCFQPENSNIMYVLDLLAWNTQPMTDGETEFRHFWMESHFRDIPELERISKKNKLIFKILPKVLCTRENFNEFMMKAPHFPNFNPPLDGLLFYHKLAHYYSGETPLVGWIYPYMVPEVFGKDIQINPVYNLEKPVNYVNQAEFIARFNETYRKRTKKFRNSELPMETAPSLPSGEKENDNTNSEPQPMDQLAPTEKSASECESNME